MKKAFVECYAFRNVVRRQADRNRKTDDYRKLVRLPSM